uniref:Sesterterpene synthase btcA n=1 Tax=Neocamarosporium betae TaxID=1979465 RepID=BTCA_NEOBT|nr:RecName: Full=Sesterterpene synthase btcA; Short=TS; AltName: Full=Betaestacins biosynthesis cluster protein A; Includes: RecName: Full=Terpene cyclase; Includes: RecName: Full=Geranylgeranyl diphosphate synthase; Short=GGDP synthase; Short=GGS; Includes: RecName: Full=Geranylfarnesyl diphosphate synthase; Short=GFDP synthase [Neocamarosporium betae]BBE36502.1 putative bifunctional terpene synthase [Neocamarosporium betae]
MANPPVTEWKQSEAIPAHVAQETGCFTTLPIRIHKNNSIADQATLESINDWKQHLDDGWESRSGSAISKVGNWCSFIFSEALPERLPCITYLANIGNIHDDATEDATLDEAITSHAQFSTALSLDTDDEPSLQEAKTRRFRHLVSNCVLEILSIDRDMGTRMIVSYQKKWLDVMEHLNYEGIESLEEYLEFRMLNGGMEPFWLMCQFGMGLNIPDAELAPTRHIFEPAEWALVLTNDYWSWGREYNASLTKGSRIVNSIELLSRLRNISYDEAKEVVRDLITTYEAEYERRVQDFLRENPSTQMYLRQFIEVAGLVVAGNHYWCANCPRHHAWKEQDQAVHAVDQLEEFPAVEAQSPSSATHTAAPQEDPPVTEAPSPISSPSSSSSAKPSSSSAADSSSCTSTSQHSPSETDSTPPSSLHLLKSPHPVDAPCTYMSSLPSKGVRSTLIHALNQWFQISSRNVTLIKEITSMLHNSSLILDDIQDQSPLRRGKPAAHTIFSTAQSINSSTYLFVRAMQMVSENFESSVQMSFLEILQRMHIGQSYDLHWRFHLQCPTEDEYFEMVDAKTGCMFEMLLLLMSSKSRHVKDHSFTSFIRTFGRYFQVRDDYMNLTSGEYTAGKGWCEDLDEGKLSYPLIECQKMAPASFTQIMGIFRAKQADTAQLSDETKKYVIELFRKSGVLDSTLDWIMEMERQLLMEVKRLEGVMGDSNPMLYVLLQTLSLNQ